MSFNTINPEQAFLDSKGIPRAGGLATFFVNTTTTVASIFSDESLLVAQTNPYTMDAYGRILGDVKYSGLMTLQVTNADGSEIKTYDNIGTLSPNETGTFTPVVSDAATGGNTATASVSGDYSLSGDSVTVSVSIAITSTAGMTGANILYIQGLPFAAKSVGTGAVLLSDTSFSGVPVFYVDGQTYGNIKTSITGVSSANLIVSNFISGGLTPIEFTMTYVRA